MAKSKKDRNHRITMNRNLQSQVLLNTEFIFKSSSVKEDFGERERARPVEVNPNQPR